MSESSAEEAFAKSVLELRWVLECMRTSPDRVQANHSIWADYCGYIHTLVRPTIGSFRGAGAASRSHYGDIAALLNVMCCICAGSAEQSSYPLQGYLAQMLCGICDECSKIVPRFRRKQDCEQCLNLHLELTAPFRAAFSCRHFLRTVCSRYATFLSISESAVQIDELPYRLAAVRAANTRRINQVARMLSGTSRDLAPGAQAEDEIGETAAQELMMGCTISQLLEHENTWVRRTTIKAMNDDVRNHLGQTYGRNISMVDIFHSMLQVDATLARQLYHCVAGRLTDDDSQVRNHAADILTQDDSRSTQHSRELAGDRWSVYQARALLARCESAMLRGGYHQHLRWKVDMSETVLHLFNSDWSCTTQSDRIMHDTRRICIGHSLTESESVVTSTTLEWLESKQLPMRLAALAVLEWQGCARDQPPLASCTLEAIRRAIDRITVTLEDGSDLQSCTSALKELSVMSSCAECCESIYLKHYDPDKSLLRSEDRVRCAAALFALSMQIERHGNTSIPLAAIAGMMRWMTGNSVWLVWNRRD